MPSPVTLFLGAASLLLVFLSFYAALDAPECLSPQGCRMSYMYPSYTRQDDFNATWTPLAERYSLWLYREARWEPKDVDTNGVPVLFIPGNAGSSHQVRSIASSAARQYFSTPFVENKEFSSRLLKRLDVYAVEFNEDLSAFHGSTIESEISYTSKAIEYILSLYPTNTQIIVLGHSMGGIVAASLLPSPRISAIITMSTPHMLPPARFDSRIDDLYARTRKILENDPTPILSLCGGAADMMIPSESCILPLASMEGKEAPRDQSLNGVMEPGAYRRTVFTSALEGAWTGVGHREMVWCHQVRWRVARAALEMGAADTPSKRAAVLDRWLRDGSMVPAPLPGDSHAGNVKTLGLTELDQEGGHEALEIGEPLALLNPQEKATYVLPVPDASTGMDALRFTLFVSRGSVFDLGPHHSTLRVSVYGCDNASNCSILEPTTLKLVPNPQPGSVFPVPKEGADESEGVVFFEASITPYRKLASVAVQVKVAAGTGWVYGKFSYDESTIADQISTTSLLLRGSASVALPKNRSSHIKLILPRLLAHALLVYHITPIFGTDLCSDPLLSPILVHRSSADEAHYFPMITAAERRVLLHPHLPAPYISSPDLASRGVELDILSVTQGNCDVIPEGLSFSVDWRSTLGRIASRYPSTLVTWAVGVVSVIIFSAWSVSETGCVPIAPVSVALAQYGRVILPKLMTVSLVIGLLPLPAKFYIGTSGEPLFAFIAPLILFTASGLVCVIWWILVILMWPIGKFGVAVFGRRKEDLHVRKSTIVSMVMIFGLIFLFIPWQVAYLGCWLIHLYTCATGSAQLSQREWMPYQGSTPTPGTESLPMIRRQRSGSDIDSHEQHPSSATEQYRGALERRTLEPHFSKASDQHQNEYFLLLMTLLLPLAAPVLVVWVRTLATAGLTTPFDGDHFFMNVAPFLILVDFASWTPGPVLERQSFEKRLSTKWAFACMAMVAFFLGPRQGYSCFDAARVVVGVVVVVRIGRRYWGGRSWSSEDNTIDNNKRRLH